MRWSDLYRALPLHGWQGQAIAVLWVAVATLLRAFLGSFELRVVPFASYFLAIMATRLMASRAAGVTALLLGGLTVWLVFLRPITGTFSMTLLLNLVIYLITGGVILWVIHRLRVADENLRNRDDALKTSEGRLRSLFDSSSEGLIFCRLMRDDRGRAIDYHVLDANPSHARLTGVTREQMLAKPVTKIRPPVDPRWVASAEEVVRTSKPAQFDIYCSHTDHWLNIRVAPIFGEYFCQAFIDVSDRHRIEQARTGMLMEMNHRVKNNFQIIASMLSLQAGRAEHHETRDMLSATGRRVQLLADLHDMLIAQPDTRQIDFHDYLHGLIGRLRASIGQTQRIALVVNSATAMLPVDKALQLGLLINEIVTNAIKHAFPVMTGGEIVIDFQRKGTRYQLTITDNGCGMADHEQVQGNGFGTRLINALAAQAGASVVVTRQPSVRYQITLAVP